MPETVQQYVARLSGLVGDQDPWSVLAATPGRLRALVSGATPDELRWTSSPTRWSTAIIMAHLADSEIVGAWRFRSLLTRDGLELQAYDQNAWAAAFHYEQTDPADSLVLFEALRQSTLRVLSAYRSRAPEARRHASGARTRVHRTPAADVRRPRPEPPRPNRATVERSPRRARLAPRMIVRSSGSTQLLIAQPDHATLAATIMRAWQAGGLLDSPRQRRSCSR